MFYSASTGGFYNRQIHGQNIPSDAVEISEEHYSLLILGQSQGKVIVPDQDGMPTLADPVITYQQALSELNAAYQREVDDFNRAFATAYLADGPTQESKQAVIRAQYLARKASHAVDVQNLKDAYASGV